jgi:hypothetical protein
MIRAARGSAVVGRGGSAAPRRRRRAGIVLAGALTGSLALGGVPAGAAPTPLAASLTSVSCTASTACTAVGSYDNGSGTVSLAEAWNGESWTVQSTPNPAGGSDAVLTGVACTSTTNCLAVGGYFAGSGIAPFAELWNGSTWSLETVPLPTGARGGAFNSVSCVAARCTAVGEYADAGNQNDALAEQWNGSSFATQAVAVLDATTNTLTAVSCSPAPAKACEAVGWFFEVDHAEVAMTLAERWDGTTWSEQSVPEPPNADSGSYPTGISCTAPRACTSVGNAFDAADAPVAGWAQRWNGTQWVNQNLRSPKGAIFSQPAAVSCTTPAPPCTTVGDFANGTAFVSFAESRTGARWKPHPTPHPKGSTASGLSGVSCLSASACTAVGNSSNSAGAEVTLAEAWDGTKWTIERTP